MRYAGVDSCRGGWFAVMMGEEGSWKTALFRRFADILAEFPGTGQVIVDIPIGLPASKGRACDSEARRLLGPGRASSVFPVPCRKAVHARDYERACALNIRALGVRISLQAWNICPRIAEVDRLLRADQGLAGIVRESHPELCLWSLHGKKTMRFPKKTMLGRLERMSVLETFFEDAVPVYEHALSGYARSDVGRDDIIDALALAVSAYACRGAFQSVPEDPEHDAAGLPMEMVIPYSTSNLMHEVIS